MPARSALVDRPLGGASYSIPMSYDDYLGLGETKHCEYYDGLAVRNPPTRRHSRAQVTIFDWLRGACPPTHEVLVGWGWRLPGGESFEPDVLVSDRGAPDDDVLREPPPLLVAEVTSPSTRGRDWGSKRAHYARGGAAWYWIVDADRPEIVVLENVDGNFVERQRITSAETALGPFPVPVDPAALLSA